MHSFFAITPSFHCCPRHRSLAIDDVTQNNNNTHPQGQTDALFVPHKLVRREKKGRQRYKQVNANWKEQEGWWSVIMQRGKRKEEVTEGFPPWTVKVNESCWNDVDHKLINTCKAHALCVFCGCVCVQCCALGSAWPAGRGSSKVIVLKGIGGWVVRATPLTALGEGDVRWTNPKLLHSKQRHQRTEEQRAGERKETKQETEKEYKRVRQNYWE